MAWRDIKGGRLGEVPDHECDILDRKAYWTFSETGRSGFYKS